MAMDWNNPHGKLPHTEGERKAYYRLAAKKYRERLAELGLSIGEYGHALRVLDRGIAQDPEGFEYALDAPDGTTHYGQLGEQAIKAEILKYKERLELKTIHKNLKAHNDNRNTTCPQ